MKILLIEDHLLFRDGLKLLLSDLDENIEFVEADDLQGLNRVLDGQGDTIDIVLLDLSLPDAQGLDALRRMRGLTPASTIVVLSGSDDADLIRASIEQGASGFIPKSSSKKVLLAALQLVLAGGSYIPPHAIENMTQNTSASPLPNSAEDPLSRLTARQRDVLKLAMQGKVNKIIARELNISEATVKNHLSACFRALDVNNRTEAVFAAAKAGIEL